MQDIEKDKNNLKILLDDMRKIYDLKGDEVKEGFLAREIKKLRERIKRKTQEKD